MRTRCAVAGAVAMLVASLLSATPAHAAKSLDNPPPPGNVTLDVITVNGSGCPAGTSSVALAPDNSAFTVSYSQYLAQVGVGSLPTDFRKNCQLSVAVHVPQGFTYAVAEADYRGFAALENGATGTERANYYFQGSPQTVAVSHNFPGPLQDDWQSMDVADVATLVYQPCGVVRNLNINTELRVSAGTSDPKTTTSFMTMDATDGSLVSIYHLAWKACP